MANSSPGKWVVAVDLGNAFSNIPRDLVNEAVRTKVPALAPLAEAWPPARTRRVAGGGSQPAQL
eukprot:3964345-Pyramimonas_sp.AAC.1